jgi:hypothetical protein
LVANGIFGTIRIVTVDIAIAIIIEAAVAALVSCRLALVANGIFGTIRIVTVDIAIAIIIEAAVAALVSCRLALVANGIFGTIRIVTVDIAIAIVIEAAVAALVFRHAIIAGLAKRGRRVRNVLAGIARAAASDLYGRAAIVARPGDVVATAVIGFAASKRVGSLSCLDANRSDRRAGRGVVHMVSVLDAFVYLYVTFAGRSTIAIFVTLVIVGVFVFIAGPVLIVFAQCLAFRADQDGVRTVITAGHDQHETYQNSEHERHRLSYCLGHDFS